MFKMPSRNTRWRVWHCCAYGKKTYELRVDPAFPDICPTIRAKNFVPRTIASNLIVRACGMSQALFISFAISAQAEKLPVNTWIPTGESVGGTIAGITYLPTRKSLLYFGYPAPNSKQSDLRLYQPASGSWLEPLPGKGPHRQRGSLTTTFGLDGRPGLPAINRPYWLAHQSVFIPVINKVLFFAGGSTFTFDPETMRWENLDIPLDKSPPDVMLGSMAWDPVGQRAILFGGGYISAYKQRPSYIKGDMVRGTPWLPKDWNMSEKRATWAFDPATNTWSKVVTGSDTFRGNYDESNALTAQIETLSGATRGIALEYGDKISEKSPRQLAADIMALASQFSVFAERLNHGDGCQDDYESSQCKSAAARLREVETRLLAAAEALSVNDGWKALHALEAARRIMLEVSEDLAPSPPPRYYGNLVTDSRNNLLILFGGHGGDRVLADTWVFDPSRNQWRQSRARGHPPPHQIPAMSFDAELGVVLLSTGWIYNAAKDEWRRLPLDGAKNFMLPWQALEYDPVNKVHVLLTTGDNLFDYDHESHRVKMAHLKLDVWPGKPANNTGPRWEWLDDKYRRAWEALPKTQREYRARAAAHKAMLASIPANTWVQINTFFRAEDRSYGSFALDPERGQLVFWGGGHSAYMGNQVSQYDIKGNLWLESWPPDLPPWPFGSPDGDGWNPPLHHRVGSAHGYHKYAYSRQLGKTLFAFGSLLAYDSDRMRWVESSIKKTGSATLGNAVDMSGADEFYTVSTKHWWGGPFGVWKLDPATSSISRIARSDTPFATNDRAKPVFDTKRNRILFYGAQAEAGKSPANQLYAYDITTEVWAEQPIVTLSPTAEAPASTAWGVSYSPRHDVLMILPGGKNQGTWLLDCATNVMRRFAAGPATHDKYTNGVVYSADHDLFITMEVGGSGPVDIHVMRLKLN